MGHLESTGERSVGEDHNTQVFFFGGALLLFFIHCVLTRLFVCRTIYQAAETLSTADPITKHSIEARQRSALLCVDSYNVRLTCTLAI